MQRRTTGGELLPGDLDESSLDELLSIYVAAAIAHERASSEGSHDAANEQHDIVAAVYRELRRRGPASERTLLALLDHPDPAVRGWAGAHALELSPKDGERTLTELAATGGLPGFNAEWTLKTWREGGLRFP